MRVYFFNRERNHHLSPAIVLAIFATGVSLPSWGRGPDYSPDWSRKTDTLASRSLNRGLPSPNRALLKNPRNPNRQEGGSTAILDVGAQKEIQQQYRDLTRDYQNRENYSLSTLTDRHNLSEKLSAFSMHIIQKIISYQIAEGFTRAQKNSDGIKSFRQVHEAVGAVAKGNLEIADSGKSSAAESGSLKKSNPFYFKLGTKTNLPQQSGTLWMESTIFNSSVEASIGKPWAFDPWSFGRIGEQTREQYRVSLSRNIPLLDVSGGLTYGGTSTSVHASLSKQLTSHLRCELAHRHGVDPSRAGLPTGGEDSIQLDYGLQF